MNGTLDTLIKHIAFKRNVYQCAMHIIFKVDIFSTIGFRQSEFNIDNSTDSDCLPIRQKSAQCRYRLSVNHYRSSMVACEISQFFSDKGAGQRSQSSFKILFCYL
jgi:hypothetical protein